MFRHPSKYISVVGTRKLYNWVENMAVIEKMFLEPPLFFLVVLVWVEKRISFGAVEKMFLDPSLFFGGTGLEIWG